MPTSIISCLKQTIIKRPLAKREKRIQPFIQNVDGDEEYQVIQSSSLGGDKINIHWLRLNLHFSNGSTILKEMIVLYEPLKCFFWSKAMDTSEELLKEKIDGFLKDRSFHLSDNKIIRFSLDGPILWLREESCEQYHTIEEAYQILFLKLEKNMGVIEQYRDYDKFIDRKMAIGMYIEEESLFFCPTGGINPCLFRTIYVRMKVTRLETTWQIELESPDKRKATALLNDDYDVLNMFLEGHTLFNFLDQISPGNEEYHNVFKNLDRLVSKRLKSALDLDQPILTGEDYEAFNQFVEEKFHFIVSYPPAPSPPDKSLLQVVDDSQEERTIKQPINVLYSEILIRSYQVKLLFPNGKRTWGKVIFLYEPQTGLFWWTYDLSFRDLRFENKIDEFLNHYYIDYSENKIIGLVLFPMSPFRPSIKIKESCCERYENFEQAIAGVFSILEKKLDEIEQGKAYTWFQRIPLWKYLAWDFFPVQTRLIPKFVPKITSVKRSDDNWQITLENFKKKQVTLILSNDYDVLDVWGEGVK